MILYVIDSITGRGRAQSAAAKGRAMKFSGLSYVMKNAGQSKKQ